MLNVLPDALSHRGVMAEIYPGNPLIERPHGLVDLRDLSFLDQPILYFLGRIGDNGLLHIAPPLKLEMVNRLHPALKYNMYYLLYFKRDRGNKYYYTNNCCAGLFRLPSADSTGILFLPELWQ